MRMGLLRSLRSSTLPRRGARPVFRASGPRSEVLLPLRRGEDAEHLAIFCHRTTGDDDPALAEDLDDALIGQRVRVVLLCDDLLDGLLDRLGREVLVGRTTDGGVEEVLELEEPLRRVDVLVRRHTADR